jgi:hypothetical protein
LTTATFDVPSRSASVNSRPGQQRNPEGAQVARSHLVDAHVDVGVGSAAEALDADVAAVADAREQRHGRRADGRDARERTDLRLDPLQHRATARGIVAVERRHERERHHAVDLHAEVDAGDVAQALDEQPRRDEQRHRERDLRGDQRRAEAHGRALAARDLPRAGPDGRDQVGARGVQRREEPEQQPGAERHDAGEHQHRRAKLEGEGGAHPQRCRRDERRHQRQRGVRDEHARGAAQDREQARLGHELCDQVPAPGAERAAHRDLGGAVGAAGEQQVRDVGAGDQHHQPRDREQEGERRARRAAQHALSATAVLDPDLALEEARARRCAHRVLQRQLDVREDGPEGGAHGRARLLGRDPGAQPREQEDPVAQPVLELRARAEADVDVGGHRHRHEDARPHAEGRAVEAPRCHADDRHRPVVDQQASTDDRGIGAVMRDPVRVAQHRHGAGARRPIVGGAEQSAVCGREPQHREVRSGHEHAVAVHGPPIERDAGEEEAVRGDAGEDRLGACEVAEQRVAERLVAVADPVALRGAAARTGRAQVHQPLGLVNGERAEDQCVEQRVGRRVGADAERDAGHGDRHEAGGPTERAQRHAQVLPDGAQQLAQSHAILPAGGRAMETLARLVEGPEAALRLGPCRVGGESLARELLGPQLQMQADLLVGLVAGAGGAAQREVDEPADAGADLGIAHGGAHGISLTRAAAQPSGCR